MKQATKPKDTLLHIALTCSVLSMAAVVWLGYSATHKEEMPLSEYQLTVDQDSLYLMDGFRQVGAVSWEDKEGINKLIEKDNE